MFPYLRWPRGHKYFAKEFTITLQLFCNTITYFKNNTLKNKPLIFSVLFFFCLFKSFYHTEIQFYF